MGVSQPKTKCRHRQLGAWFWFSLFSTDLLAGLSALWPAPACLLGPYCAVCCVFLTIRPRLMQQRKVPLTDTDLVVAATARDLVPLQADFINSTYTLCIIQYCVGLMLSASGRAFLCSHKCSLASFYICKHIHALQPIQYMVYSHFMALHTCAV